MYLTVQKLLRFVKGSNVQGSRNYYVFDILTINLELQDGQCPDFLSSTAKAINIYIRAVARN